MRPARSSATMSVTEAMAEDSGAEVNDGDGDKAGMAADADEGERYDFSLRATIVSGHINPVLFVRPMTDFLHSIPETVRRSLRGHSLPSLTVVAAHGADAVSFLHNQLTQDVQGLGSDDARLAGYCTAKGRLLATMVIWQTQAIDPAPIIRMLVRTDVAQTLVKRLSMFVLRAKVKLSIAPVVVSGVSLAADQADSLGQALGAALPTTPWRLAHTPNGDWITAPAADPGRLRGWWVANTPACDDAEQGHGGAAWTADDIAAGLPWIGATTQDLFIPQTVNLDLIGGISFTKGCYPGQEIVARSHYRGTIKRRMAGGVVASADAVIAPGADVFQTDRSDEPCGRIVDAASVDGVTRVLFEAPFGAVDAGNLRVGAANGPVLQTVALPYATRD